MTAAQIDLLLVIARVYIRAGRHGTAMHLLDVLLSADPDHAEAMRARAVLLDRLGNYETALETIERLAPSEPPGSALHLLRSLVLEALGRHAEGRKAFESYQLERSGTSVAEAAG